MTSPLTGSQSWNSAPCFSGSVPAMNPSALPETATNFCSKCSSKDLERHISDLQTLEEQKANLETAFSPNSYYYNNVSPLEPQMAPWKDVLDLTRLKKIDIFAGCMHSHDSPAKWLSKFNGLIAKKKSTIEQIQRDLHQEAQRVQEIINPKPANLLQISLAQNQHMLAQNQYILATRLYALATNQLQFAMTQQNPNLYNEAQNICTCAQQQLGWAQQHLGWAQQQLNSLRFSPAQQHTLATRLAALATELNALAMKQLQFATAQQNPNLYNEAQNICTCAQQQPGYAQEQLRWAQ